jgi:hypothetical protein
VPSRLPPENNSTLYERDSETPVIFKGGIMKQKYTILKDTQSHRLIIREYAELDKEVLSLLCEETYADRTIQSVIKSGKASLITTLRTKNLYPPVIYADKIADAVMALYGSKDKESVDLFFDDIELLAQEPPPADPATEIGDESAEPEDLLDGDFNDTYEGNGGIKKLDSSLKIADGDDVATDDDN